jgi:hypothetical protein
MRLSPVGSLPLAFFVLFIGLMAASLDAQTFNYPNFSSTAGLSLAASASPTGSEIRVSPSLPSTVGSVWYATKQRVEDGFETMFEFRITQPAGVTDVTGNPGGDGMAFVVQNTSNTASGIAGSYMGYEIANSIAVELDTWQNFNFIAQEPSNNHAGVQSAGTGVNSPFAGQYMGAAPVIPNMSDGAVHAGMVRYTPGLLSIFVDNMVVPVLAVPVNLSTLLNLDSGTAFVGFTAGGADAYENHDLLSWKFRSIPEPGTLVLALLAGAFLVMRRRK